MPKPKIDREIEEVCEDLDARTERLLDEHIERECEQQEREAAEHRRKQLTVEFPEQIDPREV